MVVFEDDIKQGLDPLPVRLGCGMGPCGCTGHCKHIIGWIDRAKYTEFLANFVSKKEFIEKNYVKEVEQPLAERTYKIYFYNAGTKVHEYLLTRDMSTELTEINIDPVARTVEVVGHKKLTEVKEWLRKRAVNFNAKRVLKDREDYLSFEEEHLIS